MAHLDFTVLEQQISRIPSIRESIRVYIESVAHDIEDKKKEEAKLQELADKMRSELDATVNAIMTGTVVEPIIDQPNLDDPDNKNKDKVLNPFSGRPGKLARSLEGASHLEGPAGQFATFQDPRKVEETPEEREMREAQEWDQEDPNVLRNNPAKSSIVPQDETLSHTRELQRREKEGVRKEGVPQERSTERSTYEEQVASLEKENAPVNIPRSTIPTPVAPTPASQPSTVSTPTPPSTAPVAPTTQAAKKS